MKLKLSILAITALLASGTMNADKGVNNETRYGTGADSIRCITNISLFTPFAQQKDYQEAYPYWKIVYDECPASTLSLYQHGILIVKWQIEQESDPAKKEALIDFLMEVYDKRIQYFGNDPRYPTTWIISVKAQDYLALKGSKADIQLIYDWLKPVIETEKENAEISAFTLYMYASHQLAASNSQYKDRYIQDYLAVTDYMSKKAALADEAQFAAIEQEKGNIDANFAQSGAADCETMQKIYGDRVEAQKENFDFLNTTLSLLRVVRCQELDVYFLASEYAHTIKPTAESAVGMAIQEMKKNNYNQALTYFQQAVEMETDAQKRGDSYYRMGVICYDQKNFSRARQYLLKAAEEKGSFGEPYILIAQMYVATAQSVYPNDPVLAKTVYYAAVDKLERARSVDTSSAERANSLISSYQAHFPSKQETFMHPELETGKTITIGGWIGERTTVR